MISQQNYQQHLQNLLSQGSYGQKLPPLLVKQVKPEASWLEKLLRSLFEHFPHIDQPSFQFPSLSLELIKWVVIIVAGILTLFLLYLLFRKFWSRSSKPKLIQKPILVDKQIKTSSWLTLIDEALAGKNYSEASRLSWKYFLIQKQYRSSLTPLEAKEVFHFSQIQSLQLNKSMFLSPLSFQDYEQTQKLLQSLGGAF